MKRPGITLLEVLFAMLVGTIGLLGAISLLPVAIEQANKGREADAQVIVGEAAVNEFKVRGCYLPDLWVVWDGANFLNFNGQAGAWQSHNGTAASPSTSPPQQAAAFCYDPLGVANYLPGTPAYAQFPYSRPTLNIFPSGVRAPVMIRAGMAQFAMNAGVLDVARPYQSVSRQFAETVCFSSDELRLERPEEATSPAITTFDELNMRPETVPDRQFSWFATMCPKTDGQSDEYVLSIAVVHRRPLPPFTPDPLGERVSGITVYDGITGGDAVLHGATEADVAVRNGDWIMLVGTTNTTPGAGVTAEDPQARFSWYKVISSEATATQTSTSPENWDREITLYGPDWTVPTTQTYAVLMTGVTAVFERTIRVQRTSLWY